MKGHLSRIVAVAVMVVLLIAGLALAQGKVDVNKADIKGLMSLKGIGEQKAKAIIKYRQMNGPFQSPDDLANVPGIGKKIIANNKGMLVIGKGGAAVQPVKPKAKDAYKDAAKQGKKAMTGTMEKAKKAKPDKK